jgi:membrane associated rhomboid family serine protease
MQKVTPVILNLLIINGLVFLAQMTMGGNQPSYPLTDWFALHHYASNEFRPHQLITHMFLHGSFAHLFFNMFGLWMFGSILENRWGAVKFLKFYLLCGVGAGLLQMASYVYDFWPVDHMVLSPENSEQYQGILKVAYSIGASGGIMGILAAFGYLYPNVELITFPIPIPIKAKWSISIMIALDVFGGLARVQGDHIAHWAHVGGALIGLLIAYIWHRPNRKLTHYR